MLGDDALYKQVLANFEKVVQGARDGKIVLEYEGKYTSKTEPDMHTMFGIRGNPTSEMRFRKSLPNDPPSIASKIIHELSRKFWASKDNDDRTRGVEMWDRNNELLWARRREFGPSEGSVRASGG